VVRFKGRFSVATVSWAVIGQSSKLILTARNGTLTFQLDQPRQTIEIDVSGTHVCYCGLLLLFIIKFALRAVVVAKLTYASSSS